MRKLLIVFVAVFVFLFIFLDSKISTVIGAIDCLSITPLSSQTDKDFCRGELANIEAELAELINKQKEQQKSTGTLKGDVDYLNSQIKALQAKIKARSLAIAQLKVSISEKVSKIETLSEKIEKQHDSLAQLIRNTKEFNDRDLVYLLVSNTALSDFYGDLENYSSMKQAIKQSVDEIRGIKSETETQKQELEKKQEAENDAKYELEISQKKVSQTETEKKKLLALSKQKEAEYQKLANEKKVRADKIRAALFELRDSKAIPFGIALAYAETASKVTGVRPALVLAILRQESNLGANVGTCNRPNDPPSKLWDKIMHPTRDIPSYERITSALGIPKAGTPLSCPQNVGYGGAMGPSQFIPSTWELFAKKIVSILGISGMPDPWNPLHAITATSTYMSDLGANKGTYTAERNAACRYYSGSSCPPSGNTARNKNIINYGNSVLALAEKIQADIDLLSN